MCPGHALTAYVRFVSRVGRNRQVFAFMSTLRVVAFVLMSSLPILQALTIPCFACYADSDRDLRNGTMALLPCSFSSSLSTVWLQLLWLSKWQHRGLRLVWLEGASCSPSQHLISWLVIDSHVGICVGGCMRTNKLSTANERHNYINRRRNMREIESVLV